MRAVFLLFVFALLRSSSGNNPRIKTCDDCTLVSDCEAANVLILKYELEADNQLKKAYCGFDDDKFPKVCCSMLSNAEAAVPTPASSSIANHPNLRLLPENCSQNIPSKLLSGHAQPYEYPWMAAIAYKTKEGLHFKCSGSLINERYVLAAAHCLSTQIAGVRIGMTDLYSAVDCDEVGPFEECETHKQDLRIEETIVHPGYQGRPSFKNYIGLIRLKKPADLTFKNAKTICLPVTEALRGRNLSGLDAIIAGWDFSESGYVSSRLQVTSAPIHTQDNCSDAFNKHKQPEDSIDLADKLCASGYGRSISIDEGLLMVPGSHKGVVRLIQHGVFSFVTGIRDPGAPTVYTDVSKYMKWILDTIKP